MKRELYLAFLLVLAPTIVNALGLGKLDLNSALNEPFEAKIQLLSPTADELDSLNVALADSEAFVRAKLERSFILGNLKFALRRSVDDGPDYIRVFSSEPIREPFLNFLVEINWSNGRLYREYTVLLDPPLYDPSARATEFKKKVESQKIETIEQVVTTLDDPDHKVVYADAFEQSADSVVSSPQINYGGGDYGPTAELDTLWSIASAMRPDTSISVNQMMLALLRANPDAFFNQNINGLKRGQILRMPNENEINALNNAQALAEVQSQYAVWDELKDNFSGSVSERPELSSVPETIEADTEEVTSSAQELVEIDPELKLVAANDSNEATQQTASVDEGIGEDLVLAQESIQALTQENIELKDKIKESDALLQDLKRLLSLKDDELAALQEQIAAVDALEEEAEKMAEEEVVVEEAVDALEEEAEEMAEEEVVVEEAVDALEEEAEEMAEEEVVETAVDMVLGNSIIAMAIGGVLIVLILIVVLMKFRKEPAETVHINAPTEEAFPDFNSGDLGDTGEGIPDSEAVTVLPDSKAEAAMPEESADFDLEIEAIAAEETPVEEEPDEDPLQEVNTYLAFEQFDQAEELVRNAINDDPDNPEYHTKLLEVFYTSGNKKSYEEAAQVLHDKVGGEGEHWNMAVAMWQEMSPNRALFEAGQDDDAAADNTGGFVDVTADEEAADDGAGDLDFDIGGAEEVPAAEDSSGSEDLLDVTAAVGLDDEIDSEGETAKSVASGEILDISGTGGDDLLDLTAADEATGEDLLDVTTSADFELDTEEDFLDVTAVTSAGADSSELLDIEPEGLATDAAETVDDNVIDFDMTAGGTEDNDDDAGLEVDLGESEIELDITAEEEQEPVRLDIEDNAETESDNEISLDFDMGEADVSESDEGISLDLDTGADSGTDEGEISMDLDMGDDAGIELDLSEAESDDGLSLDVEETPELDISLDVEAPEQETVRTDAADMDFDLSFDVSDEEPAASDDIDLESTVQMRKPAEDSAVELDDGDDEEDHTVFVPRAAQPDEQSAEDEIATKLDLAKAYVELGDKDSAKTILDEVMADGNDEQKKQAEELLGQV